MKINTQCCLQMVVLPLCLLGALEPNYTLPQIVHTTPTQERQRARQRGCRLMELKGMPDGDEALVSTNWNCPTSIVVNAIRYDVVTNWWRGALEFDIMTTNSQPEKIAGGEIDYLENGMEARVAAFADISCTSMPMDIYAQGVLVQPIDPETNMLFLTHIASYPQSWKRLVYKNICIRYSTASATTNSVATNALAFTTALINEGLPEEDRISLMSMP